MIEYGVFENWALNCLTGRPHTTCYQTTVTGYRAVVCRTFDDGRLPYYVAERNDFTTYAAADKWARAQVAACND